MCVGECLYGTIGNCRNLQNKFCQADRGSKAVSLRERLREKEREREREREREPERECAKP